MYLMDKHADVVKNTKLSGEYVQVRLGIMREFISMGPYLDCPRYTLKYCSSALASCVALSSTSLQSYNFIIPPTGNCSLHYSNTSQPYDYPWA